MLDIFNIPGQQDNVKIFFARGTTDWQTWQKPRNCKFIWMMCIGGASGGGPGSNNISGFQGGSGGGSGGVVRALFPSNVLPDTLFIQPGPGGAIAIVGNAQTSGNKSFISITPSSAVTMNIVCTSGNAAAATTSGETIATVANAGLLSLGNFIAIAGQGGGQAAGITPLGTTITCGGAGGGASSVGGVGFSISSTSISPGINGGVSGSIVNGGSGILSWKPFYALGGAGGSGTLNASLAGNGGNGAIGSGGGGGGTSTTTSAGNGGRGGDGLVIIATF